MSNQNRNALIDADKKIPSQPKKKREPLHYIEVPPIGHWFQQAFDHQGKPIWFLRLQVTGLRNRRYGPFASQRKALVFLDYLLDQFGDALLEARNEIGKFQIKESTFANRDDHYPIVEDELCEASSMYCELINQQSEKKGR